MKKTLGTLNIRAKATEPLGIGLDDLRNSKKEGQWWLVGASWKKNHDSNNPSTSANLPHASEHSQSLSTNHQQPESSTEPDILALARAQGMTTPIRRAIFAALLSATDYADAHTRLVKLRLSRKQELEIPRVLLHLVGAEENYNPYYTLVARKLCEESHRIRMAFQFALWGLFKRMGERMVGGHDDDDEEHGFDGDGDETREWESERGLRKTVNLASCYGDLVAGEKVPVTVLKTLDWAYLGKRARLFVEVLMVRVFQKAGSEEAVVRIFAKAKDAPQMVTGLKYHLENVVAKTDIVNSKKEKVRVEDGVKAANAALGLLTSFLVR
jgi:nucleolar MIF4G domain-containing protein 1